jgi:hypothetical protein
MFEARERTHRTGYFFLWYVCDLASAADSVLAVVIVMRPLTDLWQQGSECCPRPVEGTRAVCTLHYRNVVQLTSELTEVVMYCTIRNMGLYKKSMEVKNRAHVTQKHRPRDSGEEDFNTVTILTELHTPNTTVTTAHIKYSQSSLAVAW